MAVYKSKGIVLRSIRYGEADRILDLYTREAGLVSVIAKGIRRTKSRFGGRLEPLSCVDFLAYEGRTLDTITQVEVLRSFHGVRENLESLEAAGGMVANVRAFSGGDEADRRVFNLLYHALDALETRAGDESSIEAAFSLKLSILAGYTPRLDACISCEEDPEEAVEGDYPYFAPSLGGVLCAEDRKSTRLNSSHANISYAVFCLKKKNKTRPSGVVLTRSFMSLFGRSLKKSRCETTNVKISSVVLFIRPRRNIASR